MKLAALSPNLKRVISDNLSADNTTFEDNIPQSGENVKTSISDLAAQNLKAINLSEPQYSIFSLSSGTTMRNLSHWQKVG